jgi:hypothetical protein
LSLLVRPAKKPLWRLKLKAQHWRGKPEFDSEWQRGLHSCLLLTTTTEMMMI